MPSTKVPLTIQTTHELPNEFVAALFGRDAVTLTLVFSENQCSNAMWWDAAWHACVPTLTMTEAVLRYVVDHLAPNVPFAGAITITL